MEWNFSFSWLFIGILIVAAGTVVTLYHQKIADNLASGVSSYDRTKLFGIITIILGLLIMTNLHTLILTGIVNLVFRRG